jgi:hypothetical protein
VLILHVVDLDVATHSLFVLGNDKLHDPAGVRSRANGREHLVSRGRQFREQLSETRAGIVQHGPSGEHAVRQLREVAFAPAFAPNGHPELVGFKGAQKRRIDGRRNAVHCGKGEQNRGVVAPFEPTKATERACSRYDSNKSAQSC